MATKYDLPSTYVSEMVEYNRLYLLGASRTSTGNPTFTSSSSSTTYTVSDNTGENGMLVLLQTALASYIITASDWNGIVDLIVTTATANKLLKLDSNAKLPASITGDADTVDSKHAIDFQSVTVTNGSVAYTDSISASSILTKTIAIGSNKYQGRAIIMYGTALTKNSLMVFFDTTNTHAFVIGNYVGSTYNEPAAWSRSVAGLIAEGNTGSTGYGAYVTGSFWIQVTDVYINGTNLTIVFKNNDPSNSRSLNTTIEWEVW